MKCHANLARPVSLLPFHGMYLLVVEAQGVQYVPFRPVVDLLGLDWRMARRTAFSADNAELYALQELECLAINTYLGEPEAIEALFSGKNCAENDAESGSQTANPVYKYPEKSLLTKQLFIRLDRVYIYLARVSTGQMRSHGKQDAADRLLAMQKEWGQVIYDFMHHGIVIRGEQHKSLKDLFAMQRNATPEQRARIAWLIDLALDAAGCPPHEPSPQIDMFGGEA